MDIISSANEDVASEIKDVKEMITFIIGGVAFIVVAIIFLLFQNVFNYFEQYKQQLAVRQFHGYKVFDKYKEYFILFAFNWICVIVSSMIVGIVSIELLLITTIMGILFELLITLIILKYTSSRKIINVIKGGN